MSHGRKLFIGEDSGKRGSHEIEVTASGGKVKIPTLISPKSGEIRMGHPDLCT